MRTRLIAGVVVLLSACGEFTPDVPPPPPRASRSLALETLPAQQLAFVHSSFIDHAAWETEGGVAWLDASGRGSVVRPDAFIAAGVRGGLRQLDARGGEGWAQAWRAEADGGFTERLFALGADEVRELPPPPGAPLQPASGQLMAWGPGTLLLGRETASTDQHVEFCVFAAETWRCTPSASLRPPATLRGRDPEAPSHVVFDARDENGTPATWAFDVDTGAFSERPALPASWGFVEDGAALAREGKPSLRLERLSTRYAVGCYDPGSKLLPLCREQGDVTEYVFFDGDTEVAHARVERALGWPRRYGDVLLVADHAGGVIIPLP